jgi:predicted RNA binding protein YcfA (HicA-like mRNA interferase family)
MPKLRRLNGQDVIRIVQGYGFTVIRIRGSHHILRRVVLVSGKEETQTVNVPVHGSSSLTMGTLKRLYRDLQRYISEDDLHDDFYSD